MVNMIILLTQVFCVLCIASSTLLFTSYLYLKWCFGYWGRKGLVTPPPIYPYGNAYNVLKKVQSATEYLNDLYIFLRRKGLKHGGYYVFGRPIYVVADLDIAKQILVTDYQYFYNHGTFVERTSHPISGHLFHLEDEKWRTVKCQLAPYFSCSKLRMLFDKIIEVTNNIMDEIEDYCQKGVPMEAKSASLRFCVHGIGIGFFGITDPREIEKFYEKYERIRLDPELQTSFLSIFHFATYHRFKLKFMWRKKAFQNYFLALLKENLRHRVDQQSNRFDFLEIIVQKLKKRIRSDERHLSLEDFVQQAFGFFGAGFETTATTMTFMLYELATNQQIQERLRQEIYRVVNKYSGQFTYDAILEMEYMDKVIKETLRKHSPVPALVRTCNEDYVIPGTQIKIERGTMAIIPINGFHSDPQNFPEPKKFDPERFGGKEEKKRHPFSLLAFGEGHRMCIGMKFALLQMKVGLAKLLGKYQVQLNKQTKEILSLEKTMFATTIENEVWLDLNPLEIG